MRGNFPVGSVIMAGDKTEPLLNERNKLIYKMLQERQSVTVSEFQKYLGVSDMTVRRSLNEMASLGLIRRVHGGAEAIEEPPVNVYYSRSVQNRAIKAVMARRAVELIPANGSVYLDAGSSCFAVGQELNACGKPCIVITDSIKLLQELQGSPTLETMILGGALSGDQVTVDGALTAETASRVAVDLCIFSANGFNVEQMENQFLTGAVTKKILIERAAKSMFIADSSKFDLPCCFRFCGWDDVDIFLTDTGMPESALKKIREQNVEIHQVTLIAD